MRNLIATNLGFEKKTETTIDDKEGIYFLRTSLNGREEQILWMNYNLSREIEYTFYPKDIVMQSDIRSAI